MLLPPFWQSNHQGAFFKSWRDRSNLEKRKKVKRGGETIAHLSFKRLQGIAFVSLVEQAQHLSCTGVIGMGSSLKLVIMTRSRTAFLYRGTISTCHNTYELQWACGSQRITCETPTVWVLQMEFGFSGLAAGVSTHWVIFPSMSVFVDRPWFFFCLLFIFN